MKDLAPFIVLGLANGAMYGVAGLGLVLTYKTSGLFNFAHGVVAAVGAFAFYQLRDLWGLPWPLALLLSVLGVGPALGLVLARLARRLEDATVAGRIVATVGLLLGLQGLLAFRYGAVAIAFDPFLPQRTLTIGSVVIGVDQLITVAVATAGAVALSLFLRRTRLGVAMHAVVDDSELLDLVGVSPSRVRGWSWALGSAFAALSGILLAPTLGLDTMLLTLLVVQAFGAAAIGRFSSLPGTYLGGLGIGVAVAVSTKYLLGHPDLAGLPPSLPFIALFAVLVTAPKGRLVEAAPDVAGSDAPVVPSARRQAAVGLLVVTVLAAVPFVVGSRTFTYTNTLVYVLLLASLRLLVRTSGQVSLCHLSFVAVGATTFSHLSEGAGLPWLLALLGAGLVTVPIGALVSIPAIRLSRLYLSLSTLAFALLLERLVFGAGVMFGGTGNRSAPRPGLDFLSSDRGYYYVVLAVVAVSVLAIVRLERSRLGRLLRGLADSPIALSTSGLAVDTTRTIAFCISALLAGVAGGLTAGLTGTVSPSGFGVFASLTLLVVMYISGSDAIAGPVVGAAAITLIPAYIDAGSIAEVLQILFGLSAVLAVIAPRPSPAAMKERLRAMADRSDARAARSPVQAREVSPWTA